MKKPLAYLPDDKQQELKRFELLDYAYIGARYDPDYRIGMEDLELLSARVRQKVLATH